MAGTKNRATVKHAPTVHKLKRVLGRGVPNPSSANDAPNEERKAASAAPDFRGLAYFALALEGSGIFGPRDTAGGQGEPLAVCVPPNANGVALAALQVLQSMVAGAISNKATPWLAFLLRTLGDLVEACNRGERAGELFAEHPTPLATLASSLRELLEGEHAGLRKLHDASEQTRRSQPESKLAMRQARALALAQHASSLDENAAKRLDDAARKLGARDPGRYWQRAPTAATLCDYFKSSTDTRMTASFFYSTITGGNMPTKVDELAKLLTREVALGRAEPEHLVRVACRHVGMNENEVRGLFNYIDQRLSRKSGHSHIPQAACAVPRGSDSRLPASGNLEARNEGKADQSKGARRKRRPAAGGN